MLPSSDSWLLSSLQLDPRHQPVQVLSIQSFLILMVHGQIVRLIGNLVSGHCYQSLKEVVQSGNGISSDPSVTDWGFLECINSDLIMMYESMAGHLFKLLLLVTNVINGMPITPNAVMTQSVSGSSLPSASLSPLRRKPSLKVKEPEVKKSVSLDFIHVRLFNVIKSSYLSFLEESPDHVSSSKVSSSNVSSSNVSSSKVSRFTSSILTCLSQILEVAGPNFLRPRLESILEQLKVVSILCPIDTIVAMKQCLKCIFSTNFSSIMVTDLVKIDSLNETEKAGSDSDTIGSDKGKPVPFTMTIPMSRQLKMKVPMMDKVPTQNPGLYNVCISEPLSNFSHRSGFNRTLSTLQPVSASTWSRRDETSFFKTLIRKNFDKRLTTLLDKGSSIPLSTNIKHFEPMVIKSLKLYTTTSDIQIQEEILTLLSLLIKLRVNYSLLDSEQVFFPFHPQTTRTG